ncbi:glycogen debranching protein GlgX [Methylocystis heyeri]|uniref:4-alpha-glucanotransferase n=1 Tax=Methylocystis heyeri TaxID=391905 RepID=A0A6B8KJA2_9HYPH|nr:glycogen debranching protein GlgX [Methylocystis heyeri]QGM46995.1 glycogen debranching protein GlgX [Methylocystis heyeri]
MRSICEGAPEPLGLALTPEGANVAVYSASAEAIELCLFDEAGEHEIERIGLCYRTGDVFHAHIGGLREGARYGLRAQGPFDPHEGHRFNASKLLIDPYALALDRPFRLHPSMFGYCEGDPARDLSFSAEDSAALMPKCVAARPVRADLSLRPRRAFEDLILYELHVRGFTKTHPDIPVDIRGTFKGLAHEAALEHLLGLGVTAVEIMPCAAYIDERHLARLGLSNYWGYNPVAMLAPDPRLAPGGWDEVRESVAQLHRRGLEVIVDVVFNHTGEGDELGPTLSLRGLDNAGYYRLRPDSPRLYVNDSGCGNILGFDRAPVVRYALDALRAWAELGGVDGFRFDLATTLARRPEGFDGQAPLLTAIAQDPVLRELKLVAEPWDIGPGGYQLGNFPAPFAEWNDRFRDCARRFWRGDAVGVGELATRVSGSRDFFENRRRPSRSVNYIVAHDGFTLRDLVSYSAKRNHANGEENRDGGDENFSWNHGIEGETDDPAVVAARARDERNLLATLLFARGAPMIAMGAEMGKSQSGNNNAYAQDNETAWLDWARADRDLIAFVSQLIALRKSSPAIGRDRFLTGLSCDETLLPDVEWRRPNGRPMQEEDWRDPQGETLVASLYDAPSQSRRLIVWRRGAEETTVALPAPREGYEWRIASATAEPVLREGVVIVPARSVTALKEEASPEKPLWPAVTPDELLRKLAQAAGVAPAWRDVEGAEREVPGATTLSLLAALGLPASNLGEARDSLARLSERDDRRALPQSVVFREDETIWLRVPRVARDLRLDLSVTLERGERRRVELSPGDLESLQWRGVDGRTFEGFRARLPRLPLGRHVVSLEGAECLLTVAPRRCHTPSPGARKFGIAAQLYAVRREGDQGVGDFTTLSQLARLSAGGGAAMVALNPLHALFAQDRERASPYYPSDRLFLDPLYLDVSRLSPAFDPETPGLEALREAPLVDYPGVYDLKQKAFHASFSAFADFERRRPEAEPAKAFAHFVEAGGGALLRFACFEAISEERGGEDWRRWPQPLRDGEPRELREYAGGRASRVRYHQYLQWLCDGQLAQAAAEGRNAGLSFGFCRDLAVGAAPDGCESWRNAGQLLKGFSIGAPPDPFSREGQIWGLPPYDPLQWKADGCAAFTALARANMKHAGALRIDHAMGLARLFLVPEGAKALEGAYLSYPLEDLLGQLALESSRAECLVVGEDLGTLPWGFRDRLNEAGALSYRVLWFEREGDAFKPPAHYAEQAMACVSTHDLPTLRGWWEGRDIEEKSALDLLGQEEAGRELAGRRTDRRRLLAALAREGLAVAGDEDAPFGAELAAAAHAYAARAPSWLAMAQLDDLAGEAAAINLPGTDRERPNWRRKLTAYLPSLFTNRIAACVLAGLRRNVD